MDQKTAHEIVGNTYNGWKVMSTGMEGKFIYFICECIHCGMQKGYADPRLLSSKMKCKNKHKFVKG